METFAIIMSIVIVLVVGFVLIAPSSLIKRILGTQKKED